MNNPKWWQTAARCLFDSTGARVEGHQDDLAHLAVAPFGVYIGQV